MGAVKWLLFCHFFPFFDALLRPAAPTAVGARYMLVTAARRWIRIPKSLRNIENSFHFGVLIFNVLLLPLLSCRLVRP